MPWYSALPSLGGRVRVALLAPGFRVGVARLAPGFRVGVACGLSPGPVTASRFLTLADGSPSRFFIESEFWCRCGGRHGVPCPCVCPVGVSPALVSLLESLRESVGPLHVSCGYRCPAHNAFVGGAPASFHLLGAAADIVSRRVSPSGLYVVAVSRLSGFGGVGLYPSFVHVDVGSPARRKVSASLPWVRVGG